MLCGDEIAILCAICVGEKVVRQMVAVREVVSQLKCRCLLNQRGCEWGKTVTGLLHHLDECIHMIVPCPYSK